MKFIPILFSTAMVKSIMDGRKTMTRRIVPEPFQSWMNNATPEWMRDVSTQSRYGQPGDVLWVRETWFPAAITGDKVLIGYKPISADNTKEITVADTSDYWRKMDKAQLIPSIFMPKAACRLFLQVESVRVELLLDISEADAIAEGILPVAEGIVGGVASIRQLYENYLPQGYTELLPKDSFQSLWQSINGEASWEANPFVWVISFKRIEKPKGFI